MKYTDITGREVAVGDFIVSPTNCLDLEYARVTGIDPELGPTVIYAVFGNVPSVPYTLKGVYLIVPEDRVHEESLRALKEVCL